MGFLLRPWCQLFPLAGVLWIRRLFKSVFRSLSLCLSVSPINVRSQPLSSNYLCFSRQFPRLKQFHLVWRTMLLSFSFIKIRQGKQWCMSPHVPEELARATAVWQLAPLTPSLESSGPTLINLVASTTLILSRILPSTNT